MSTVTSKYKLITLTAPVLPAYNPAEYPRSVLGEISSSSLVIHYSMPRMLCVLLNTLAVLYPPRPGLGTHIYIIIRINSFLLINLKSNTPKFLLIFLKIILLPPASYSWHCLGSYLMFMKYYDCCQQ